MTRTIVPIVEGDGEVQALPVLLRRIAAWRLPEVSLTISRPIRVRRDRFLKREDEWQRMLQLASAKAGVSGAVLLVLDADDDCPAQLGPALMARVAAEIPHLPTAVVLANREYEAWFLAAAASLDGVRGFGWDGAPTQEAELPRDAKGWMRKRIRGASYSPVNDQAAFSERLDLDAAFANSRSFRKLVSAFVACFVPLRGS